MRAFRTVPASLAMVTGLVAASIGLASPASATVHEITRMLCAVQNGNASPSIFAPPGISGVNERSPRSEANVAKPLFATGVATFVPGDGPGGADLIRLDDTHPAAKFTLTGELVSIGDGLFLTAFTFDAAACIR